jgi:hypothetical protein
MSAIRLPVDDIPVSLKAQAASAALLTGSCLIFYWLGLIPDFLPARVFILVVAAVAGFSALTLGRRALRSGISLLLCGTCLLCGDLLWRLKPPPAFSYRPDEIFLSHWPPMPALSRYQPGAYFDAISYGDLAAMAGRPDYREYRHLRFRSDRLGYPNDTVPDPASVILLGDSFGAGTGTSQEKTWASLLRTRYGVALYNLSVPESGPWQELLTLKARLPEIRHSSRTIVLWAVFSGNDLDDDYGPDFDLKLSGRVSQALVSLASFRNRSPVRRIFQRLWYLLENPHSKPTIDRLYAPGRRILFRRVYAARALRTRDEVLAHPNFPRLRDVLGEMGRFAVREGLAVKVVSLPAKEDVYADILSRDTSSSDSRINRPFAAVLQDECSRAGLDFVDLTPAMVDTAKRLLSSGELLWWADDTHWNENGHALAAKLVYDNVLMLGK